MTVVCEVHGRPFMVWRMGGREAGRRCVIGFLDSSVGKRMRGCGR